MLLGSRVYCEGDSPVSLREFLEGRLVPGGEYYASSYMVHPPGTEFEYANFGFALLGYLVESISGAPFDDYTQESIFKPLGMTSTGWHLADLGSAPIAMPYRCNDNSSGGTSTIVYQPLGQYGYPDYPDGSLRTSARQLARFLGAIMNGGMLNGARILEASTVRAMLEPTGFGRAPRYGAIWETTLGWTMSTYNGELFFGHYGADWGVSAIMDFRPSDGTGVVLLANGDFWPAGLPALVEVERRLFEEARRF